MGEGVSDKENQIASAIKYAAKWLGTGDAASTMGALEFVGACIRDASETVVRPFDSMAETADRIADAFDTIASALRGIEEALRKNAGLDDE